MSNKERLAEAFEGLAQGDGAALVGLLHDEVTWKLIGTTAWSGQLTGKMEVLTKLLMPLGAQLTGNAVVVAQTMVAEGDLVVVQARGQNTTRKGKAYNNEYCFVFRFADGWIREVHEYADTALVNETLDAPGRA